MNSIDKLENLKLIRENGHVGIGEAARILEVETHTLRYWEKEFEFYLEPPRTAGRQRRYDELSLEKLGVIKRMLKDEGFSIAGARRKLAQSKENPEAETPHTDPSKDELYKNLLQRVRRDILEEFGLVPEHLLSKA
jgi:DNA-binding transcriptional MerR regulator